MGCGGAIFRRPPACATAGLNMQQVRALSAGIRALEEFEPSLPASAGAVLRPFASTGVWDYMARSRGFEPLLPVLSDQFSFKDWDVRPLRQRSLMGYCSMQMLSRKGAFPFLFSAMQSPPLTGLAMRT